MLTTQKIKSAEAESVQNIFDWILKQAPSTGSADTLAQLILFFSKYPRLTHIRNLDVERREWIIDMISLALQGVPPQEAIEDGEKYLQEVIEAYAPSAD